MKISAFLWPLCKGPSDAESYARPCGKIMNFDQTLHHTRSIFEVVRKQPISERTEGRKKILISFFQCVKVSLFFFRTPVHMHVLTIPLVRDRGYTDGRVKCRKPVEEPRSAWQTDGQTCISHRYLIAECYCKRAMTLCQEKNLRFEKKIAWGFLLLWWNKIRAWVIIKCNILY